MGETLCVIRTAIYPVSESSVRLLVQGDSLGASAQSSQFVLFGHSVFRPCQGGHIREYVVEGGKAYHHPLLQLVSPQSRKGDTDLGEGGSEGLFH